MEFRMKKVICLFGAVIIFGCSESWAAQWQVGSGGDFSGINEAFSDAGVVDGDVILVAAGTYYENVDFWGKNVTLQGADTSQPELTIIDGGGVDSCILMQRGEDANAVVDGFTLTNGKYSYGGGIFCSSSSGVFRNCIISDNEATKNGAGAQIQVGASPRFENCVFRDNAADEKGGAIYAIGSTVTLVDCVIEDNSADYGGGLYVKSCELGLTDCDFLSNSVTVDGGWFICFGEQQSGYFTDLFYGKYRDGARVGRCIVMI